MRITIISSLFECDLYIDNYLNVLSNLIDLENNKLIIWNVIDSNNIETNNKIQNFCYSKEYITLIKKTKKEDTGLYDCWNHMLEMVDTELVCNFNVDDKLHKNFIIDYLKEFNINKELNLLCCPLLVSKNLADDFDSDLSLMYHKKKIFYGKQDVDKIQNDTESDFMDYEYKYNLLKKCLSNNDSKTITTWTKFNNISIFDFFRIDGNNFIDLNNYNMFCFCGCAPVWKVGLFKKYGGFNEKKYGSCADLELWARYFEKEGSYKILTNPYIIYYCNSNSYGHITDIELFKRKIVRKYHPIFKLIDVKLDVIIPYRNRPVELDLFIKAFKKSYDIYFDYTIIICEQTVNSIWDKETTMNVGFKYSIKNGSNKILFSDVDLIFHKINLGSLLTDHKIYGTKEKINIGGGSVIFKGDTLKKSNGCCNFYNGWACGDMDFGYRLFFNNRIINMRYIVNRNDNDNKIIEELKLHEQGLYIKKNNDTLINQVINYNLIFYYENKEKFIKKDDKIYFKEKIFFQGKFNDDVLENGDLYDLFVNKKIASFVKENDVLIYKGSFRGGLPFGLGSGYNLWGNPCFSGLMLNGYLLKNIPHSKFLQINKLNDNDKSKMNFLSILNQYVELNILKETDFKLYKKYVYNGLNECDNNYKVEKLEEKIIKLKINVPNNNKFCNLHFSKKLNPGYEFINNNFELINFKNHDSDFKIETKKFNEKTLFYLNQQWQYPAITEKKVFDLYYNKNSIPHNYFAFPWATLIDQINFLRETKLMNVVYNYKIDKNECFTVCQHISFRRLLPLFKKIGITHVFASHASHNDYLLEEKYNIKIVPFPLFPVNYNSEQISGKNDTYLFSFCGAYHVNYYLTDVRDRLNIFKDKNDCYVKIKNKWHFNDIVYEKQIKKNDILIDMKKEEMEFSELLLNSTFSLCPGGSGPNSIRLWESLSYGCIPVILSNEHKLPDFINWDDFCILYDDRDIGNLYEYLISIPKEKISLMKEKCKKVFNSYFSKENFNKIIDIYFDNTFIQKY